MLNFFHCVLRLHWKKLTWHPVQTAPVGWTVMVACAVPVSPASSVTISVTVKVPVELYA